MKIKAERMEELEKFGFEKFNVSPKQKKYYLIIRRGCYLLLINDVNRNLLIDKYLPYSDNRVHKKPKAFTKLNVLLEDVLFAMFKADMIEDER